MGKSVPMKTLLWVIVIISAFVCGYLKGEADKTEDYVTESYFTHEYGLPFSRLTQATRADRHSWIQAQSRNPFFRLKGRDAENILTKALKMDEAFQGLCWDAPEIVPPKELSSRKTWGDFTLAIRKPHVRIYTLDLVVQSEWQGRTYSKQEWHLLKELNSDYPIVMIFDTELRPGNEVKITLGDSLECNLLLRILDSSERKTTLSLHGSVEAIKGEKRPQIDKGTPIFSAKVSGDNLTLRTGEASIVALARLRDCTRVVVIENTP